MLLRSISRHRFEAALVTGTSLQRTTGTIVTGREVPLASCPDGPRARADAGEGDSETDGCEDEGQTGQVGSTIVDRNVP